MNHFQRLSKTTKCKIGFFSIKPEYAQRLVEGVKRFEFRKTSINSELTHMIIYATKPVGRIIGVAFILGIDKGSPYSIWEKTKYEAGISRKEFRNYFKGKKFAFMAKVEDVMPLDMAVCPFDVEPNFVIPQSFSYVDMKFLESLIKKGMREGQDSDHLISSG